MEIGVAVIQTLSVLPRKIVVQRTGEERKQNGKPAEQEKELLETMDKLEYKKGAFRVHHLRRSFFVLQIAANPLFTGQVKRGFCCSEYGLV